MDRRQGAERPRSVAEGERVVGVDSRPRDVAGREPRSRESLYTCVPHACARAIAVHQGQHRHGCARTPSARWLRAPQRGIECRAPGCVHGGPFSRRLPNTAGVEPSGVRAAGGEVTVTAAAVDRRDVPCIACGHPETTVSESIGSSDVIAAWRRDDHANGATATIDRRSEELQVILPARIEFRRCARCGLQMADPPTVWPAAAYPRDQSYPVRWEFRQCVDDLGSTPLDVLEIGCGTGRFLAAAAERGHRAVGIDFSASAIAEAQARGVRAFCGGFDELARHVGGARFDAVAFFHVIEHMPDPDALLSALAPWMRPNARLFLSCPGPRR